MPIDKLDIKFNNPLMDSENIDKIEEKLNEVVDAVNESGSGMENPMTTAGDLIVGGSSGTPSRLGKGTAGQVLAMNSEGTAPEWSNGATKFYHHFINIQKQNPQDFNNFINLEVITNKSEPYTFTTDLRIGVGDDKVIFGYADIVQNGSRYSYGYFYKVYAYKPEANKIGFDGIDGLLSIDSVLSPSDYNTYTVTDYVYSDTVTPL